MVDLFYYVNGHFVAASQAAIAAGDLGLVRGYGVFDVLRTYGGVPFALRPHLQRLQRSAQQIDLALPWTIEELEQLIHRLLALNAAATGHYPGESDLTIRLIVTGGVSADFLLPGNQPSLLILPAPVRTPPAQLYHTGATLVTADIARFMPSVKSINYIGAILGQKQARQAGAVEALYCTQAGVISECTTANFFVVRGGQLITPDQDILAGVTRAVALELAAALGDVLLRPIPRQELAEVDEAFITSTTKEIMPIVRIDDVVIGSGRPGPYTQRLAERFQAHVRQVAVAV